jgi:hypothetical protein
MTRLALIAALIVAASPATAQRATTADQSQAAALGVTSIPAAPAPPQAPTTGVFCIEEMTATFCNVVSGPNTNGYGTRSTAGSSGGSGTSGGAGGGTTSSIPPCSAEPPFNELCD